MEAGISSFPWLELIDRPAFCVVDGIVAAANAAAKHCMLQIGTDIQLLVAEHKNEYNSLTDGYLYLPVTINGFCHSARVTRTPDYDIFVINWDTNDVRLQALALAAQQLRIPLSDVMTAADQMLANMVERTSAIQRNAEQVNRGLFKLLRITSNMSDVNNYTRSAIHDMRTINITGLIDETIEKIKAITANCDTVLHYNGLGTPVFGLANEELLERALYNLISNAIKFSPSGSTVDVRLIKKENRFSIITFNRSIESIAHDRFWNNYQREPSIADSHHGLGLGMTIVSTAAFVHGGTVLVEQPSPSEIRVTLTMPIKKDNSGTVRSPVLSISDYAGGRDKGLLELADILPAKSYKKIN